MTKVYYRDAVGAIIVFDVTRASTFEAVEMWKKDLDRKVGLSVVNLVILFEERVIPNFRIVINSKRKVS